MAEPVVTIDGHAFERLAIENWFEKGNETSPITQERLEELHLIPNLPLKKLIKTFLDSHQVESAR